MKRVLIVGGTSGLGLALANIFKCGENLVTITGRFDPEQNDLQFVPLNITNDSESLVRDLERVVLAISAPIELLIYSAGFSRLGTIGYLADAEIKQMVNIGILAPSLLVKKILCKQTHLPEIIVITSTSQWIPRPLESVYCATKAGLSMFANSISLDENIGKVLVAVPAGMNTKIQWERGQKDNPALLDPNWVAEQIAEQYAENFEYKLIRILREPPRTEVLEKR
ncbi:MAG: SDR family NAD(P)-dependent oxidoreductase [bacterium]|nr:SDR family NAD(P)-dependent oxidoreductase [bacterium]